jgi:hypothetical protein
MNLDNRFETFSWLARPEINVFRFHHYRFAPQTGQGCFWRTVNPGTHSYRRGDKNTHA